MALLEKISQDLNEALKSRDGTKVSVLRLLISGIHNAKIAKGGELTDEEVLSEVARDAKRHRESIDAYTKGERADLAEKEKGELAILQSYLPEQMSEADVANIVSGAISELGAKDSSDMGRVMGAVMAKVKGKVDGTIVSRIVKERLSPN